MIAGQDAETARVLRQDGGDAVLGGEVGDRARAVATVLGATIRVEPVKDPRSDWFVRRLSTMPGDTLPD